MEMIVKYRKKQFLVLFLIFIFCSIVIFVTDYQKEKKFLIKNLDNELTVYSQIINNSVQTNSLQNKNSKLKIDSIVDLIQDKNIRVTIINLDGKVIYDNRVKNIDSMENHANRPEIKMAKTQQKGTNIRISATNHIKYYYFAKKYKDYFVRISIRYNEGAIKLIEPDKLPILFILFIFFLSTFVIVFVTDKFGKSLTLLKRFTHQASNNQTVEDIIKFPKNELGLIGQDIVDIYEKLNKSKIDLLAEKEKLIRHLNMLDEGIAIFNKDKKIVANNSSFIQFLSLISDNQVFSPENFFEIKAFTSLFKFIETQINPTDDSQAKQTFYEVNIHIDSRIFSAKSIVFQDNSIEIIINDITRPARRKILKQQLTENIAHELKTPVSSIKGFLETIIDLQPDKEKLYYFIKKAYSQTCRLTNLINDISLLTKIEEASNLYKIENINLSQIIKNVIDDVDLQLKENNIGLIINVPNKLDIEGNSILLYSIFRNLFDNTLSYAGKNLTVRVEKYMEDDDFYYFSFSDSGIGVPESDLQRLFERFYRVEKGRDHRKGGTGLGLAIVKNAVIFHNGEISVKNRKEGGLEFIFSLKKKQSEGIVIDT